VVKKYGTSRRKHMIIIGIGNGCKKDKRLNDAIRGKKRA
jgi:hypothetical protein